MSIEDMIDANPDLEDAIIFDGLDEAILGWDTKESRFVYSADRIHEILMEDDMTDEEAYEYFSYNIECLYAGEKTPIIMWEL
jgi:hypothetical protein